MISVGKTADLQLRHLIRPLHGHLPLKGKAFGGACFIEHIKQQRMKCVCPLRERDCIL